MHSIFYPFFFLVVSIAGWMNQHQQHVIDYLIEALDAFTAEQDRRRGTTEAPLHRVQLPLFGGASAGGMCSSIATVFVDRAFPPVHAAPTR